MNKAREKANISKHEYTAIQSSQFSFRNGELQLSALNKACPFVERECLDEGCMAWRQGDCRLISRSGILSPFELKLRDAAPLMYRSLLDLVRILLNELIGAELAGAGIRAEDRDAE